MVHRSSGPHFPRISCRVADRDRPHGRTSRPGELQGRAYKGKAPSPGSGERFQVDVFDDVDPGPDQEMNVTGKLASELIVVEPNGVPGHVVCPDRENMEFSQPLRSRAVHPRSWQIGVRIVPELAITGTNQHYQPRYDLHVLSGRTCPQ